MKKTSKTMRLLAAVAALCVLICAFAGCKQNETHTCQNKCETCGKCTAECTESVCAEKCEGHEEGISLTEGIFKATVEGRNNTAVLKFKEDGTFYAHGLDGQKAYMGKYEIVDMEINYVDWGADGNWDTEEGVAVLKATKAIAFYDMDGNPMTVRNESNMYNEEQGLDGTKINEGIAQNYCAYTPADGAVPAKVHAVGFNNDPYTRTLTQDTTAVFTEDDEIKNLLYHFMVAALPEWAVGSYEANELEFKLYHNSFEDMATVEVMESGSLTVNGNVYTLSNGATITVDPDAYTAVYKKGDVEINLIKWMELGTVVATVSGNLYDGAMTYEAKLYDDGTLALTGNMMPNAVYGSYVLNSDNTLTLDIAAGSMTVEGGTYDPETKTVTINLGMGQAGVVSLTGVAEGKLAGGVEVLVTINTEVEMVPGYPEYNAKLALNLNDNGTAEVLMNGAALATARWEYNAATYSFDIYNVSNGTLTAALSADGLTFTWIGDISENATGVEVVFTTDTSVMADIQSAVLPQTKLLLNDTQAGDPMSTELEIRFLSDGTGILKATTLYAGTPVGGVTVTFNWALTDMGCNFTEVAGAGDGASITYAMKEDYSGSTITFTMIGSSGEVSYVINCELAALGALK